LRPPPPTTGLASTAPATLALWPLAVAYAVAFVAAFGASAAYIVGAVLPHARGDATTIVEESSRFALSAPGLLGSALVDAASLALVTAVAASLMRSRTDAPRLATVRADLRLGPTSATWLGTGAAMLGMVGLSVACGALIDLAGVGHTGVMDIIARALAASSPARLVVALLAIGVAPAVAEESFFRGLVQTRVAARWGRWPAIVVSAFAFGLFHVDPVQGSLAFVAGLFLGWVADRFGGIRPGVAAHAFNNAAFVLLASFSSPDEHPTRGSSLAVAAAGAVAFAGAVAVLTRARSARPREPALRASTPAS
jgi:uncharacterized protein